MHIIFFIIGVPLNYNGKAVLHLCRSAFLTSRKWYTNIYIYVCTCYEKYLHIMWTNSLCMLKEKEQKIWHIDYKKYVIIGETSL